MSYVRARWPRGLKTADCSPPLQTAAERYARRDSLPRPLQEMRVSVFCLAPTGAGWGLRLVEAMQSGCIPLIIQVTRGPPARCL